MPAYVIYQCEVTDPERYAEYRAKVTANPPAGGRFLVRGGEVESLEGDQPPGRTVVIEFPNREAALAWYHGPDYTEARAIRATAAVARMYLIDGVDPSPA